MVRCSICRMICLTIQEQNNQKALVKLQKRWIAALLAITALVAISCGGSATATPLPTATPAPSPSPTPGAESLAAMEADVIQRYIDAVAPAFQAALLERQAIDQELAAPGPQAQSRYVATWLVRVTDMRLRLVDAVKVVEPPASLASNHDDFVLATSAWVALGDELVERIAEAGVQFNVAADLAGDPELGVTAANQLSIISSAACARIEGLAAANGIDADLACDAIVE